MGKVEEFLKLYEGKGTYAVYRWALGEFFKTVKADSEQYFTSGRNYEADVNNFLVSISSKPPKTVRLMISVVKGFLIENGVELPERFWRRLNRKIKGSRALTIDKVPSNEELKKIITYMPIHGKALFLVLASSGMRIGEALALKVDDVDLSHVPPTVKVRGKTAKTGNSRLAFISSEAKEYVEEWLKQREAYIKTAAMRIKQPRKHFKAKFLGKNLNDNRLFPFEQSTALYIWTNAVRKAGFLKKDSETDRYILHPHVLRKFFRTKMATLVPVDVVEVLMGHEEYLTDVYRRYSQEELAKFYLQGEPSVLVYGVGGTKELREDLDKIARIVNNTKKVIEVDLEAKNRALEEKVKKLESLVSDLYRFVHENFDPLMEFVDLLSKHPEFERIKLEARMMDHYEKQREAEEEEQKFRAEITREMEEEERKKQARAQAEKKET